MEIHLDKVSIRLRESTEKYVGNHARLEIECGPHKNVEVVEVKGIVDKEMIWSGVDTKLSVTNVVIEHGELAVKLILKEREQLVGTSHYNMGTICGTSSLPLGTRTELVSNLMGRGILREKTIGETVIAITIIQTRDYVKEAEEKEEKRIRDEEYLVASERERETKCLADVFDLFGRSLNEKLEHLEILKMYRIIEKAHVSHFSFVNQTILRWICLTFFYFNYFYIRISISNDYLKVMK